MGGQPLRHNYLGDNYLGHNYVGHNDIGHPLCGVDKWEDNHYAIDSMNADTSSIIDYIDSKKPYYYCESKGHRSRYRADTEPAQGRYGADTDPI